MKLEVTVEKASNCYNAYATYPGIGIAVSAEDTRDETIEAFHETLALLLEDVPDAPDITELCFVEVVPYKYAEREVAVAA